MNDVTTGRVSILTDTGAEEFEYVEYVPAEVADKLLAIIRFAVSRFTDPHMVSKDPAAVRLRDMAREVGIQWPWEGRA